MDSMFAGLPAGTTIASWFNAKTCGVPAMTCALTASFIVASLAVASAVTGAPLITWSTIVELEPKLVDNRVFGLCNSNCSAITVNTSVNEAAAEIWIEAFGTSPDSGPPDRSTQPTVAVVTADASTAATRVRCHRLITTDQAVRSRRSSPSQR